MTLPNFQVVSATMNEENQSFTFKAIIADDDRYLGYVFEFKDVLMAPEKDGIGISYDLEINTHCDVTLQDEEVEDLKSVGHQIIEKVITDLVRTVDNDSLTSES